MSGAVYSGAPRWSLRDIAARDGVTTMAVSKAVAKLVAEHGLDVDRDTRGRVSAVNLAQYDHLRGKDNAGRVRGAATAAGDRTPRASSTSDYNEALTAKTRYESEKRRLEVEELKGELVRVAAVADAAVQIAAQLARLIDQLPNESDHIAAAVQKDGEHGARVELKRIGHRWRNRMADLLAELAEGDALATAKPEHVDDEE